MTDDRKAVLDCVRKALNTMDAGSKTPLPEWDDDLTISRAHPDFDDPWDLFAYKIEAVHGDAVKGLAAVAGILREAKCKHGFCDAAFADDPALADFELETTLDMSRVDDYEFGITRAAAVIAETGSIVLYDADSPRLGALAPWIHVAVVKRKDLVPDVPTAISRFGDDPYIVFATGPSKTGDIEGILIEGVHGPGKQIACLLEQ
jgi:L-lactate dehydrogenase complex protein LldG